MEEKNIILEKVVVHILDSTLQMPLLSENEHPPEHDIHEFIKLHLARAADDEGSRICHFCAGENSISDLCFRLQEDVDLFIPLSQEIASLLYTIMCANPDIPSADLVIALYQIDQVYHIGILKLNYKTSFIHHIDYIDNSRTNFIIRQTSALPTEKQRIEEAAMINLDTLEIRLIEKPYEINGDKTLYFSTLFLKCSGEISNKDTLRVFKKVAEDITKKYYGDDVEKKADLKKAVHESVIDCGKLDFQEIASKTFHNNPEVQGAFIDDLKRCGITQSEVAFTESTIEKNFQKQKLKTDLGIELNIPIEWYKDPEKIEFIANKDGTISIMIKNINKLTGR